MIKKKTSKKGGAVRVTFELPKDVANDSVSVVGDFNDWDKDAHPMKRLKKGTWKKDIYLEPGNAYQFRYFVDGKNWRNDEAADKYVPNPYFEENSVVDGDVKG